MAKKIIYILMAIIGIFAVVLNRNMKFTIVTIIGFALMIALSFIRYEWIEKWYVWFVGIWIVLFVLNFFTSIGTAINGVIYNAMFLLFLPLLAIILSKFNKKNLFWIFAGILAIAKMLVRPLMQWETLISRKGEAAYIYEQIDRFTSGSRLVGKSEMTEELASHLPEFETGTILTTYGVEYGNIVKIIVSVLLVALLGKIIFDMLKNKAKGYLFALGCAFGIGIESLVFILQNIPVIPFKGLVTFLPFFSNGIGGLIICYLLMGGVICVYNNKDID